MNALYWKKHWEKLGKSADAFEMLGRSDFDYARLVAYLSDIHRALHIKKRDRIIDVGCSNGLVGAFLSVSCSGVIGYDRSKSLIVKAQEYFSGLAGIQFFAKDAEEVPLTGANKLVAGALLQYLSRKQTLIFLKKIARSRIERAFICHVPWSAKKEIFLQGYADFIFDREQLKTKRNLWEKRMTWYSEEDFHTVKKTFDAHFVSPDPMLVAHKYSMDIILKRK